jgi:hypothetical protein
MGEPRFLMIYVKHLRRIDMGLDSAIRKLVREVRELVADEVRAHMSGEARDPAGTDQRVVPGPAARSDPPTRTVGPPENGHPVPHAPSDLAQPILDAAEAAWILRYPTLKAFYQAVHRYGIPHARRGHRVMLFRRADLEKFLASRTRDG